MCRCTPEMRTPFCGRGDCQWPDQKPTAHDLHRRRDILRQTKAQASITDALRDVEDMGTDTRLTDAAILLRRAREAVADFVDGVTGPRTVVIDAMQI